VTTLRLDGWSARPEIGVVVPDEEQPGWMDAAFWCALLEAWGFRFSRTDGLATDEAPSISIVPAAMVDADMAGSLLPMGGVILAGRPSSSCSGLSAVRAPMAASSLDRTTVETALTEARTALEMAASGVGLVSIWRWPNGKRAALVVDGDVDHPTGVEPECARYVRASIETARRAGLSKYGIFAAAANVAREPSSFPTGAEYYNHSFDHPYSYWNEEPWQAMDAARMREEIAHARDIYREVLDVDDRGLFRLPHFQLEAWDRTADVLEELGYRAESSIGSNFAITGGLPFHPSRRAWSARVQDAPYARTHPEVSYRRPFLQIPISSDTTDPSFPNGFCSYNTLGEGVRQRSSEPREYEEVLHSVLSIELRRSGLAHLFIDPPDAGYGRLPGDRKDYAAAVERFLTEATSREDLAIMSTAELVDWWLAREDAVSRVRIELDGTTLTVNLDEPPHGTTLEIVSPRGTRSLHAMSEVFA
jgi:peptidoglycan/xylan/chitin deacetylase (PgdA/CDA1 family)